jgi:predicted enzyme related to lactoylglutathione lyase
LRSITACNDPYVLGHAPRHIAIERETTAVRVAMSSISVNDQSRALAFYAEVLGFVTKSNVDLGAHRWITVVAPDAHDGHELALEPDVYPPAKVWKEALVRDGIPAASFAWDDVATEVDRLTALGVEFRQGPTVMGPVTTAIFDDTCGNLIQLASRLA